MISTQSFWMGRDVQYADEFTPTIQANGEETVQRVNTLLALAEKDGVICESVSSGWRPQLVNDATSNAAGHSTHISALACDIQDDADRNLAYWCIRNQAKLVLCELWMEDPRWTGGEGHTNWVHLQTVPPMSDHRIYIPSTKPPFDVAFFNRGSKQEVA